MNRFRYSHISLILLILCVYLIICFWRLNEIPGEWFGDISLENKAVEGILSGRFPWRFFLSSGPVYNYFASVFVILFGVSYTTYKLSSITMGAFGLMAIYLLGRTLVSPAVGLLSMIIGSVSFWYIVWARLGNSPQILSPLLVCVTLLLTIYYHRTGKWLYFVSGGVIASLGLFSYPALFLLPLVWLTLIAWDVIIKKSKLGIKIIIAALGVLLPGIYLFLHTIQNQPQEFGSGGYIGSKIPTNIYQVSQLIKTGLEYFIQALGMFHLRGDVTFRVNVPYKPHLDPISGMLLLAGVILLFVNKKYKPIQTYIWVPFLLLLLPSISPVLPPSEIPNSGRTLGLVPIVFIVIAIGMYEFFEYMKKRMGRNIAKVIVVFLFLNIATINLQTYYVEYPKHLPNRNSPFGKIIADYIDTLPPATEVKLSECCWSSWGQPEPAGIYHVLKRKTNRESLIHSSLISDCQFLDTYNDTVIIMNPANIDLQNQLINCNPHSFGQLHKDRFGQSVFYSLLIPGYIVE